MQDTTSGTWPSGSPLNWIEWLRRTRSQNKKNSQKSDFISERRPITHVFRSTTAPIIVNRHPRQERRMFCWKTIFLERLLGACWCLNWLVKECRNEKEFLELELIRRHGMITKNFSCQRAGKIFSHIFLQDLVSRCVPANSISRGIFSSPSYLVELLEIFLLSLHSLPATHSADCLANFNYFFHLLSSNTPFFG